MDKAKLQGLKKKAMIAALAVIPAVTSGVLSYIESKAAAKDHADEATDTSTENTLASVTPAITELQGLVAKGQREHVALSAEINKARDAILALSKEVSYCRAYVDFDSRGHYRPPVSTESTKPKAVAKLEETSKVVVKPMEGPKARIPDTAQKAQDYSEARIQLKCSKGDPLCGADAL